MNYTGDEMDLKDIKKKVKKSMDKQRYDHTKGVMYTAGCLAMANEYPIDKLFSLHILLNSIAFLNVPTPRIKSLISSL